MNTDELSRIPVKYERTLAHIKCPYIPIHANTCNTLFFCMVKQFAGDTVEFRALLPCCRKVPADIARRANVSSNYVLYILGYFFPYF